MKNIVTGLLILSVIAFIAAVVNVFLNLSFESVSYAVMAFLVTLGFATLELHLEGEVVWDSEA